MSDHDSDPKGPKPKDPKDSELTTGVSAKALEEMEERLVKRILSHVTPDDPGEGSSKQMEKGE